MCKSTVMSLSSHLSAYSSAEIWKSSQRVAKGHLSSSPDGLHAGKVALDLVRPVKITVYVCKCLQIYTPSVTGVTGTVVSARDLKTVDQIWTFQL